MSAQNKVFKRIWMRQQPNLPWGDPKVLSAQESLTSVFGMRTGGSSPLSSPQWLYNPRYARLYIQSYDFFPLSKKKIIIAFPGDLPPAAKADNCITNSDSSVRQLCARWNFRFPYKDPYSAFFSILLRSSPRPISIGQLHTSLCFHLRPINLVVYKGSYYLTIWDILSWGEFHA